MAFTYNTLIDFGEFSQDELDGKKDIHITTSPYWCIAVYRLKYPSTYDRTLDSGTDGNKGKSFSNDFTDAVKLEKDPLIIANCASLTCNSSKNNHIGTMSAVLLPDRDYLNLIFPGDYVFCWMLQDQDKFKKLLRFISEGKNTCTFGSGLKFYGRVNGIREQVRQNENGIKTARYMMNGTSFSELDSTFFYEQHLSENTGGLSTNIAKFNLDIDKIFDVRSKSEGLIPDVMVEGLIDVYLGKGIKKNLDSGSTDLETRSTFGTAGDYSFIVPTAIGKNFGKTIKSGKVLRGADVLEVLRGVQTYDQNVTVDQDATGSQRQAQLGKALNPNIKTEPSAVFAGENQPVQDSRRFTGTNLLGRMSITAPALTNKPLWSVLNDYLNPACNEMYATLKVNTQGFITPTVVVRQLPFTLNKKIDLIKTTPYSTLPIWKIPSGLMKAVDVGRSDGLRINFMSIFGNSGLVNERNASAQLVESPPRYDDLDIARSGLRTYIGTVNCYINETRDGNGPQQWMALLSDFVIGQHLMLTGTLTCYGIPAPICIGDNIEWDSVIYHIESISHECSMDSEGRKTFITNLTLTHGLSKNDDLTGIGNLNLFGRISGSIKESENASILDIYDGTKTNKDDTRSQYLPEVTKTDIFE